MFRKLWLLLLLGACGGEPIGEVEQAASTGLVQVTNYGDSYDGLKMWKYVPANMPSNAPLLLALHPCGFTAPLQSYATNSGWNTLADKYKFYVVYAEQISANNSMYCFNWAGDKTDSNNMNQPTNLIRGQGENQAMINMIKQMEMDYSIDSSRVFVTGFSGGGAQTALMLALWPDVFAGGSVMEGVPYHCTLNKNEVSNPCMNPGKNLTAQQWGDFVRGALPAGYSGPWPKLQVWEGSSDTFVGPDNVNELVKQWTNVRGISATPQSDKVLGNNHNVYSDNGAVVIETFLVAGMSHAVAIDPSKGCGTSDFNYYSDKGICSTEYAAQFFGLQNPPNAGGNDAAADGAADAATDGSTAPSDGAAGGTPPPTGHPSGAHSDGGTATNPNVMLCSCRIGGRSEVVDPQPLMALLVFAGFTLRRLRRRPEVC